jgi:hypothetical protein
MAVTLNASNSGTGGLSVTSDATGNLALQTAGTTAFTINYSQAIGLGSTPSYGTNGQVLTSSGSGAVPTWTTVAASQWTTTGSDIYYTTGKVSIGTTVANNTFHVYKSGDGQTPVLFQTGNATGLLYFYNDSNGWSLDTPGEMRFVTNRTGSGAPQRMMLSTGGYMFVSTASSLATMQNGSKAGFFASPGDCGFSVTGTSALGQISFYNPNGGVGSIQTSGTSTIYNTGSDYRLKENIQPMTNALSKVAQLKPCTFKWKCDGSDGEGFIAHELAEVFPIAVSGEKDGMETYTDEDGNQQTRPKWQGIDTSFLVGALTKSIQELKAINDSQAATITSLTARIVSLENKA